MKHIAALLAGTLALFSILPVRAEEGIDMYRMYNPNSGEHFYTGDANERDFLMDKGWQFEGAGWVAPYSGTPVYRLYNPNAGDHHYTVNAQEKDHLVQVGWNYEGIGWYSDTSQRVGLWRQYNPNAKTGTHNFTTDTNEKNHLVRIGWQDEGVAWYGIGIGHAVVIPGKNGGPLTVNGIAIVNKKHGLASSYAPGVDSTALAKARQLIADMQKQGMDVSSSTSNYRSYAYQQMLYNNYVAAYGQNEADTFSARPGYSEHQTGLAFDLMHRNGSLLEKSRETEWLARNARNYGFIIRYKAGKESVTGYIAEPWHIRYVGSIAGSIEDSGLTLEEFFGVEGGNYQ